MPSADDPRTPPSGRPIPPPLPGEEPPTPRVPRSESPAGPQAEPRSESRAEPRASGQEARTGRPTARTGAQANPPTPASQTLASRRGPRQPDEASSQGRTRPMPSESSRVAGDRSSYRASSGRTSYAEQPGAVRADYVRAGDAYGGGAYGGNAYGGGGGGNGGGFNGFNDVSPAPRRTSGMTILIIIALVSFFGGFAMRDIFVATQGFDDERPIQAEDVPSNLRQFCVGYNGYPSFTLINIATTSALTATTVPILRLETCTIPNKETANALSALGVQRRSETVGLQLGGSDLTLINLPLADTLARQLYGSFPALREGTTGDNEAERIGQLEEQIAAVLRDDIDGLGLQNVTKTNQPNVYAVAPGHTFNMRRPGRGGGL